MLLDGALFEDGFVWVGLFVADWDAFVLELANEFVGVDLAGELVDIGAGAVLVDEVGVAKRDQETRGFGRGNYLAAENDCFDRGPRLSGALAAPLLPSPPVDCSPGEGEVDPVTQDHQVEVVVADHG